VQFPGSTRHGLLWRPSAGAAGLPQKAAAPAGDRGFRVGPRAAVDVSTIAAFDRSRSRWTPWIFIMRAVAMSLQPKPTLSPDALFLKTSDISMLYLFYKYFTLCQYEKRCRL
jgi:hypothetical protein